MWDVIEMGHTRRTGNDYHVVPVDDLKDHVLSPRCWCHPMQEPDEPGLWVHNALDQREEYEDGRKPS